MITSEIIKQIISDKIDAVAEMVQVGDKTAAKIFDFRYYVFYDQYDEDEAGIRTPVLINPCDRDHSFAKGYKDVSINGTVNINVNVNKIALLEWLMFKVQEELDGRFFSDIIDGENCRYSLTFDNLVYSEVFKSSQGNSISITVPFASRFFLTEDNVEIYTYQDYAFEVDFSGEFIPVRAQSIALSASANQEAMPFANQVLCGTVDVIKNRSIQITSMDFKDPFLDYIRGKVVGGDNKINEPVLIRITLPRGEVYTLPMNISGIAFSILNNGVGGVDITLSPTIGVE